MTAFKEVWPESGVDDEETPPGLMVPLKRWNFVLLEGGSGLTLKHNKKYVEVRELKKDVQVAVVLEALRKAHNENDPTTADWFELLGETGTALNTGIAALQGRMIAVRGKKGGMSNIEAVDPKTGQRKAKLVTTVHAERRVKVSFNFLKHIDAAGQEKELSRWNPANVNQWITDLNNIFTPQANVVIKRGLARWVTVRRNLGTSVSIDEWDHVSAHGDPQAHLNIFFVGTWTSIKGRDPFGSFFKKTKDAVCDDRPSESLLLQTLSHEIGHFLGAGHEPGGKPSKQHWLMASSPRTGNKIIHQWAINFNPWP